MTTIAYRNKVMAADTLAVNNGVRSAKVTKIWKINGHLVGASGDFNLIQKFKAFFTEHGLKEAPYFGKDVPGSQGYVALIVKPDGELWRYEEGGEPWPYEAPFTACGSGRDIALAAMEMGADAERAVKVACKFDIHSGLPIQKIKLGR